MPALACGSNPPSGLLCSMVQRLKQSAAGQVCTAECKVLFIPAGGCASLKGKRFSLWIFFLLEFFFPRSTIWHFACLHFCLTDMLLVFARFVLLSSVENTRCYFDYYLAVWPTNSNECTLFLVFCSSFFLSFFFQLASTDFSVICCLEGWKYTFRGT